MTAWATQATRASVAYKEGIADEEEEIYYIDLYQYIPPSQSIVS